MKPIQGRNQTHHDTDGLAGIEGSVSLRNLVIQTGFPDHGDEDVIRLPGDVDPLRGDFTKDPAVALVAEKLLLTTETTEEPTEWQYQGRGKGALTLR